MPDFPKPAQSLLGYLRVKNPLLDISLCGTGSNSKSTSKVSPWDPPTTIAEWEDFEYDALLLMYGGKFIEVLKQSFELHHFTIPKVPFCQIHDENSLDSLLIKWNQSVTCTALSVAQQRLKSSLGDKIFMCRGGQAKWPNETEAKCRPDWAAVKSSTIDRESEDQAKNLLPGDTKLSREWSSSEI